MSYISSRVRDGSAARIDLSRSLWVSLQTRNAKPTLVRHPPGAEAQISNFSYHKNSAAAIAKTARNC
jgi:hypothetical protein